MRIGGLASGIDTETIISDLMKAQRLPLEKIMQKKQYMEWQRDDYRTVNRSLFTFRNLTSDTMLRQATFVQKTATTSSPEDVAIKNISSVSNFSGSIKVHALAEQATMRSTEKISETPIDLNAKISTLEGAPTGMQTIKIKSMKADGTLETGDIIKVNGDDKLDGFSLTFDPSEMSIKDVLDKINKDSNVSAFYDTHTGKIAMTAKNAGDNSNGNEIELEGNMFTFLKLSANNVKASAIEDPDNPGGFAGSEGVNSKFTLNGMRTQRSSNTFTINGFELSLKKASETNITFSSATDTDKIFEAVKKFADEYNKIIEDLNGQIREKKYRDFQPLSTEQKSSMKEKEIELWEEKAKSGTLRNDSIISGVLNKMRSTLSSAVAGVSGASALNKIGITTSKNYLENGKLVIDENELRKAISEDTNQVYELFAADGTGDSNKGLARRLVSALDETRKQITEKAGSDSAVNNSFILGRSLNDFDSQVTRFEDRLKTLENRYWKQFTAMETAIQKANSQSSYLTNMFSTRY